MFCLQATRPTVGTRRVVRSQLQLHYQLVGLLLAAGPDGMPVGFLARTMYHPTATSYSRAYSATLRLIESAGGALPVWQCERDGQMCVGLDAARWAAWLAAEYGIGGDGAALLVSPTGGR